MTDELALSRTLRLTGALERRLRAFAVHVLPESRLAEVEGRGPGPLLDALVRSLLPEVSDSRVWALLVAVTGAFPVADQVRSARRALASAAPETAFVEFLRSAVDSALGSEGFESELVVVTDGVVVDVDFCARHLHNTGIQRVVRQTVSRWKDEEGLTLVGWTDSGRAMRTLSTAERDRVVDYVHAKSQPETEPGEKSASVIVLPLRSTVAIVEVPRHDLCDPLAALAEFSDNRVVAIGYDAIPVVSADTLPGAETERFVRYLSFIKHVDTVAAISAAVQEEFAGFARSVAPQGLAGPESIELSLPVDAPDAQGVAPAAHDTTPLVLCVGSQEPRKNHDAVLFASEVLWREGLDFKVRFIGRGSLWFTKGFDKRIDTLAKRGRDIAVLRGIDDETMLAMYQEARFTVFPSLQEGYGLPVAESLAQNTPVITTGYGSTGEIARDGGCLTIDPRDDDTLVAAMRSLLVDRTVVDRLTEEIARRPKRTWDDYAGELWSILTHREVAVR